jgi:hypothetical protein
MPIDLVRTIMKLHRRAEQDADEILVATFVDTGALSELLRKTESQVIYGRRGTGKTHAFKYLENDVRAGGGLPIYIDMRKIGSSGGLYADSTVPLAERATRLVLDVLGEIHNGFFDYVVDVLSVDDSNDVGQPLLYLEDLGQEIATSVRVAGEVRTLERSADTRSTETGAGAEASVAAQPTLQLSFSTKDSTGSTSERMTERSGAEVHRVHFGAVSSRVEKLIRSLPVDRVIVLLDEWSSVPVELQPYLADLLRRALFTINGLAIKIAAIEQRSNFEIRLSGGDYIGIEIGADAPADIDLDDFMVFGNDADASKAFFAKLLYRHVRAQLIADGQGDDSPVDPDDFIRRAFTQQNAFEELVRASEGVPRDALNILMLAATKASEGQPFSIPGVRNAARLWYLRDKQSALNSNPQAQELLHWIMSEVLEKRQARAFLLLQGQEAKHPQIRELYDARLLHLVRRSIAARDQPGVRFNGWSLDYGCYVELVATAKAPKGDLAMLTDDEQESYANVDVPLDDYRSIRRAILDLELFDTRQTKMKV